MRSWPFLRRATRVLRGAQRAPYRIDPEALRLIGPAAAARLGRSVEPTYPNFADSPEFAQWRAQLASREANL